MDGFRDVEKGDSGVGDSFARSMPGHFPYGKRFILLWMQILQLREYFRNCSNAASG